jgi:hypothetical protein
MVDTGEGRMRLPLREAPGVERSSRQRPFADQAESGPDEDTVFMLKPSRKADFSGKTMLFVAFSIFSPHGASFASSESVAIY